MLVEVATQRARAQRAQHHALLHQRATQIDITVTQTQLFGGVVVVELERRGLRPVEDLELLSQDLDLAGRQLLVDGALGARPHAALDPHHEFVAHLLGGTEHLRQVGVVDHLDQPAAIAQVDEDDATMVTTAVYPAAEFDGLVSIGGVHFTTIMAAHGVFPGWKRRGAPTRGAPAINVFSGPAESAATAAPGAASVATGRLAALGFRRFFLGTLEVGLVPATTLELETGDGHQLRQICRGTGRAIGQRGGTHFLHGLELVAA